ncbi:CPBP family intramembrane glutamic endopeptidase [Mangrovibacterium lignilyticum]|uniref:CPBP family intramembrane glutamic endopeptidase n=1 Tax=Mangrovibacterium lignilyticum TaxID=2668052 RepID=UPI0013D63C6A|nr:type II CAAX endopeptidase family protein [Mangrovibacterium lignilyticum]
MYKFHGKVYPDMKQSFGILGMYFVFTLLGGIISIAFRNLLPKDLSFFIVYLVINGLTFVWAYSKRKRKSGNSDFNMKVAKKTDLPFLIVATLALLISVTAPIVSTIPISEFMRKVILEMGQMKGVIWFITLVIAAPVFEELIFRGIILDGLLKKYQPLKAILLSSVLFGLAHLNTVQFVGAFIGGMFMGWVYWKTRNVFLTMLIHATTNCASFIAGATSSKQAWDESLVETYGGTINLILSIVGGFVVLAICFYYLNRSFGKARVTVLPVNEEKLDLSDSGSTPAPASNHLEPVD